jgi:hypothetical protein
MLINAMQATAVPVSLRQTSPLVFHLVTSAKSDTTVTLARPSRRHAHQDCPVPLLECPSLMHSLLLTSAQQGITVSSVRLPARPPSFLTEVISALLVITVPAQTPRIQTFQEPTYLILAYLVLTVRTQVV